MFWGAGIVLQFGKTCTTPLHSQRDGLVEHCNHTLATQLAVLVSEHQEDWDKHLPYHPWHTSATDAQVQAAHPVDLTFGEPT